jgi:hypothetical protein
VERLQLELSVLGLGNLQIRVPGKRNPPQIEIAPELLRNEMEQCGIITRADYYQHGGSAVYSD